MINERYEQGSIILTSNRAPAQWPELFAIPCSPRPDWTGWRTGPRSSSSAAMYRAKDRRKLEKEVLADTDDA